MYLEKIELIGFKSFAQKTSLEFKQEITAIVGPNGSGKTNLVESIRWVLGEQSLKLLRGKKSEDVIFAGTRNKSRMGFSEVSLHLNNEDEKAPIDYREIVITRRLFRNGESDYLINKSKVRLQDISLLLAKAGFGLKSFSIIGQGMVDHILQASPLERKEFFEEAAGIKQYQIKRDEAIKKLEATKENLKKVEIILEEISPRLRSLTRQVHRLEKREIVEKELKELQKQYYGKIYSEIEEGYKKVNEEKEILEKERKEKESEIKMLEEKLSNVSAEESREEIFQNLQKNYKKILEDKNSLQQKLYLIKLKEKEPKLKINQVIILEKIEKILKLQEGLIQKISLIKEIKDLEEIKKEALKIKEELNFLLEEISPEKAKSEEIGKIEGEIKEKEEKLNKIEEEISEFNKKEEEKRNFFINLQRELQNKQNEYNFVNSKENEIKISLARFQTKKEDLEKEIKEELGELKFSFEAGIEVSLEKIQKLKSQLLMIGGIDPEIKKEYQETKERFEFLSEQNKDLKEAIKSLEKIISKLDEIIEKQFNQEFETINKEFSKYFRILFKGGNAKLSLIKKTHNQLLSSTKGSNQNYYSLTNEKEDGVEGIEIFASPPNKKLKNIQALSGGEKALTSIALICAILSSRFSPFVVLDEVDASLDEANSLKFAQILEDLSRRTQFIVITHNRATMEKAKILYGITMAEDGISKILSLKLE